MTQELWEQLRLPVEDRGLTWELFHENSKLSLYEAPPSDEDVLAAMAGRWDSLPYESQPLIALPAGRAPLRLSLEEAITTRQTARNLKPVPVSLGEVSALLYYAYGETRDNRETGFPRPFRTTPSGGALYPLELFFYSGQVADLPQGLYHYNPHENALRALRQENADAQVASLLVQPEIADHASLLVFITSLFERTTFKYGDRGYRFSLIEAGHVAQNMNLVSNALGLGCVNIGGFFDRRADEFLDLDGITHSTVYLIAIGMDASQ